MRKLTHLFLVLGLVSALASCGKKEDNSSSSAASAPVVVDDFYAEVEDGSFGNYDALKTYFTSKKFNEGVANNTIVYHIGPKYGMASGGGGSFNANFCIKLFGTTIGDCDDMGEGSILQGIIDNGEYKVVRSSTTSTVSYDEAMSVTNDQFDFEARTFDVNTQMYREMLNIDDEAVVKVVVSPATITLTDGSTISGDLVEYFYGTGSVTGVAGYILSKSLPLVANPVAIVDAYNGFQGALNNVGTKKVNSIQAEVHTIQVNHITGEIQVNSAGNRSIQLNVAN